MMSMGREPGTYHPVHRSQRGVSGPPLFRALKMRQNPADKCCCAISLRTIRPEPLERESLDEQREERQKEETGNRRREGRTDGRREKRRERQEERERKDQETKGRKEGKKRKEKKRKRWQAQLLPSLPKKRNQKVTHVSKESRLPPENMGHLLSVASPTAQGSPWLKAHCNPWGWVLSIGG